MTPGRVVGERFEVEQAAGRGGMGSVFRARDAISGERVALKILHADMQEHAERFLREAQILAELRHPGIVRYVAHGEASDCGLYLAMEWLEGEDPSQRGALIRTHRLERAPLGSEKEQSGLRV